MALKNTTQNMLTGSKGQNSRSCKNITLVQQQCATDARTYLIYGMLNANVSLISDVMT